MKRTVGVWLALTLAVVGVKAWAEDSACARAYAQTQKSLDLKLQEFQEISRTLAVTAGTGTGGLYYCATRARHWTVFAGCAVGAGVAGWVFSERYFDLEEQLLTLKGQVRIQQIYSDYTLGQTAEAGLSEFFSDIGVDLQKEQSVLATLKSGIEGGSLCGEDGKTLKSYEEVVSWLRNRT